MGRRMDEIQQGSHNRPLGVDLTEKLRHVLKENMVGPDHTNQRKRHDDPRANGDPNPKVFGHGLGTNTSNAEVLKRISIARACHGNRRIGPCGDADGNQGRFIIHEAKGAVGEVRRAEVDDARP